MREISEIICSCGGNPIKVPATKKEIDEYGCERDKNGWSCCVCAYECSKCKTRWTFSLEAPEME
ncbi:MAG: hypothetical protein ACFFG0_05445 [Candidatus Thorarchaeota archaeon]